ncbi:hypothetical protein NQ314_010128 [Rhamnusium bicolor]|uniref:Magnesium transporter n=1 Tax=Rhamnusium bicolor TaxID=1586634 RepID=A0AAV8XU39_9CUCU|nr:hypothetical protein NQ314_010128 [Rhamnusium bicolor]
METTTKSMEEKNYNKSEFYIGLTLAISSSIFIGSSFIIKKLSLIRLARKGSLRAGAGGFGYLKDWLWWLGFLTMGIGEMANFAAYAFAPASLVTPLGALSVLVSAVLASKCLKETLNILGKLGCLLCMLGATIMVIHAPKEEQIESLDELVRKLRDSSFLNYVAITLTIVIVILIYVGPRYGNRHVTVYVTLCSAIGSLTVMACKGLGLAIKDSLSATSINSHPNPQLLFGLMVVVVVCICIQMNYLNKVLDIFSTSVVTPIYYVLFTTMVIIASAILFKEWEKMDNQDMLGGLCGFLVTVVAIFLLNAFKDSQFQPLLRQSSRDYGSNVYFS